LWVPPDGNEPYYASLVQASDGAFYGTTLNGGVSNIGSIFKLMPGGAESVLHSFTGGGSDGDNPHTGLIQASDGNFYGITTGGGAPNEGTVFRITPAGSETVLYVFIGGIGDGAWPTAALIQGSDGNLYGTTTGGGAYGWGTVFKLTPGGTETILHSFNPSSDGAQPYAGLIEGNDGNYYGVTLWDSMRGGGTVFQITPDGILTLLHDFAGGSDGANPYSGLILASDGNFYGTTQNGGASTAGTVFQITPAGLETVLYSFGVSAIDGAIPSGPLIQDTDGSFYGTTLNGGTAGYGTVYKMTPH
jgi:uncharacterized repeat protein (TIGR03803 family)